MLLSWDEKVQHKLSFSQEITLCNSSSGHGDPSLSIEVVVSFPIIGKIMRS